MKIYAAMADAMADVTAIGKTKRNTQQGFNFRGIDDVYNQLHSILAKHRIFSAPEVLAERSEERKSKNGWALIYRILTIKYTFYADDGSNVSVTVIGEGMDPGDKAANKAMSVAHKYALFQVFMIPTAEVVDPDVESYEVEEKNLMAKLAAEMEAALAGIDGLAAYKGYRADGLAAYKAGDSKKLAAVIGRIKAHEKADDKKPAPPAKVAEIFADDNPADLF